MRTLRIFSLAAMLLLATSCGALDRDFRSRFESVSFQAATSREERGVTTRQEAGATLHLRRPDGLAK